MLLECENGDQFYFQFLYFQYGNLLVESLFPEFYLLQRNFTFVCCKENIIVDQFSTKEHSKRFVTLLQSGLKHLLSMEEENKTN